MAEYKTELEATGYLKLHFDFEVFAKRFTEQHGEKVGGSDTGTMWYEVWRAKKTINSFRVEVELTKSGYTYGIGLPSVANTTETYTIVVTDGKEFVYVEISKSSRGSNSYYIRTTSEQYLKKVLEKVVLANNIGAKIEEFVKKAKPCS